MITLPKTKKKLLVIAGSLLIAAGIACGTAWFMTRQNSEDLFYQAMAAETPFPQIAYEKSQDGSLTAEAYVTKDSVKMRGMAECSVDTADYGTINLKVRIHQIEEDAYFHYDEFSFSNSGDKAWEQEANAYLADTFTGKWVSAGEQDQQVIAYKEYGVSFGHLGAMSRKKSSQTIADLMRKHKVVTILSAHDITHDGKEAVEYNLLTHRSDYERFIDAVQPEFKYKDYMLDLIFPNDEDEEVSLIVDKKTGEPLSAAYYMDNPCISYLSEVDPSVADSLPSRIRVKSELKDKSDVGKLTTPAEYLTPEEFGAQFAEE